MYEVKIEVEQAYLKGKSNFRRSTLRVPPYCGHTTKICEEKEMKEIRRRVPPTHRRENLRFAMLGWVECYDRTMVGSRCQKSKYTVRACSFVTDGHRSSG